MFKLPPNSCDAHCHVFGPSDRYPLAGNRAYTPADAPKEALAALHGKRGIDRAVIVHPSICGPDNRVTLDAMRSDPARYRGVAMIDDNTSDSDLVAEVLLPHGAQKYGLVRDLDIDGDGCMALPDDGAGLGVGIDFDLIKRNTVGMLR